MKEQITRPDLFVRDVLPQDACQGGMPRHRACFTLRTTFQLAWFVDLPRVGALLADRRGRRVDQHLAPLVVGVGLGQGHVIHPHGHGFLGSWAAGRSGA
ncbi:hypothetical protein ADL25_29710 [Streptomyces sp. NRRL F-5122]|nr:hypothetical protein ADL25_29710 [Streptomyces sp. NRRL F-5122]